MPGEPERLHLAAALQSLEAAQGLVRQAAEHLSNVGGGAAQWKRICNLYDAIKADWHRVDALRRKKLAAEASASRKTDPLHPFDRASLIAGHAPDPRERFPRAGGAS